MPFPWPKQLTILNPTTKQEFLLYSASLREFLENQHHDDGTHGDVTADSVTITGDLIVQGSTGLEDLTVNSIVANEIETELLTVLSSATIQTLTIQNYLGSITSQTLDFNGHATLTISQTQIVITDQATGDFAFVANAGGTTVGSATWPGVGLLVYTGIFGIGACDIQINTNKFTVDGATGDTVIAGTLGVTGLVTLTGSLSVGNDLNVVDDFSVNTNKFTVDGGTGDTVIAGTLSVTKVSDDTLAVSASRSGADVTGYIKNTGGTAASTTSRLSIGQTNSESTAIQIIFNHNDGVATFFNRLTTTGTIKLKTTAGETIMANDGSLAVDGTTFNVDATNNRVGIGTASPAVQFHTTGAVRFANFGAGVAVFDASGNISSSTTLAVDITGNAATVTNGLYENLVNFGPGLPVSITVVNGQITAIS